MFSMAAEGRIHPRYERPGVGVRVVDFEEGSRPSSDIGSSGRSSTWRGPSLQSPLHLCHDDDVHQGLGVLYQPLNLS